MAEDDDRSRLYRYHFGSACFDEPRFELRVDGLPVEVQTRPLKLLALLLAHADALVTHEQIDKVLWSERIAKHATADNVLANAVSKLRAALGEANAQRLVTVPRQGYRLRGPVRLEAVGPRGPQTLALLPGQQLAGPETLVLQALLVRSPHSEAWLAQAVDGGAKRVCKLVVLPERLAALRREATVYRYLRATLGERPDLVQLLDWNFDHPPFYLASAWAGTDLAQWAAEGRRLAGLPPAARLALFLQVADVVAAAHGVAVLHRDLKPANILVDDSGAAPQARLTDFGSAAMLEPERLQALQITQVDLTLPPGGDPSLSGTALYLAPELIAGDLPSARSDLYALGVILYQLMAGDCNKPMASGWQRDVPDLLMAEDIARATDTDATQRQASVAEFAAGLRALPQRHAARSDATEQAQRLAMAQQALQRAHARRPWVLASLATLTLALGSSLWLMAAERRAAQALARQNSTVLALNQVLTDDLIGAANPGKTGRADITVAEALDAAASGVASKFAQASPLVRGGLHAALQQALAELSRMQQSVAQGRLALAAFAQAADADPVVVRHTRLRLALDLAQLSQMAEAAAVVQAIEGQPLPTAVQDPAFRARLLVVKSWLTSGEQANQASTRLLREAWALARPLPAEGNGWREPVAFALADSLTLQGDLREGETLYRELLAEQQARHGLRHARPYITQMGLGNNLVAQRRWDDALAQLQPAERALAGLLGPTHRMTLSALDSIAGVDLGQRRPAQAYARWAQVHDGFAKLMGANSSATLAVLINMGVARLHAGQPAQAEPLLRQAQRGLGSNPADGGAPQLQLVHYWLADCLLDLGRPAEAAPLLAGLQPQALRTAELSDLWPARIAYQRARRLLAQAASAPGTSAPEWAEALALLRGAASDLAHAPAEEPRVNLAAVQKLLRRLGDAGA